MLNTTRDRRLAHSPSQCITALGDSRYGIVMIPIVMSFSRTLAVIASNLDRNPALLKQSNLPSTPSSEEGTGKVTFTEDAANVLRDAFIKCLAGSPGVPRTSKPSETDKRIGIYLTANSTLKLLFQCRKLRNAQQMFNSIDAQSPPLDYFPAAQRVSYLYHLGLYHFANSHFYRSAACLQAAYTSCHRDAVLHRRLVLTYLIASNFCLGKLPSQELLQRPECAIIAQPFLQLSKIIKSGDLGAFSSYLDISSPTATFFLKRRILLQLRNRCEILVWRSLIRKCFIHTGYKGADDSRSMPFLRLSTVHHAAHFSLSRFPNTTQSILSNPSTLQAQTRYIDPDFAGLDDACKETGFDLGSGDYSSDLVNQPTDPAFPPPTSSDDLSPTIHEVECVFLSLISQGLLRGFVANHTNPRFAIPGSKARGGAVPAGFPSVFEVVKARMEEEGGSTVPGWVREEDVRPKVGAMRAGPGSMAGRVVNLSGARPVGSGMS